MAITTIRSKSKPKKRNKNVKWTKSGHWTYWRISPSCYSYATVYVLFGLNNCIWLNLRTGILHAQLAGRIYRLPQKLPANMYRVNLVDTIKTVVLYQCVRLVIVTHIKQQNVVFITSRAMGIIRLYYISGLWRNLNIFLFYICHTYESYTLLKPQLLKVF